MQNDRKTAKVHVPEHQKEQLMLKKVKDIMRKKEINTVVVNSRRINSFL